MQFREVLFQIRMVWSSEQDSWAKFRSGILSDAKQRAYNPWHLVVELDGAQIVEMSVEGKEAAPVCGPDVCEG